MIKKVALTFAMTGICYAVSAQTITDALRYSTTNPTGSSRILATGGAAGSLGGDYSSMFINPAGVAFFKTSEAGFSLGFQNSSNTGTYLGTKGSDNRGNLYVNSAAFIFGGSKKNPNSKWENFSIGLGITRTNNYNDQVYYRGVNKESSFSDNYLIQLRGVTDPNLLSTDGQYAHGADLAYKTGLIGPHTTNGQPDGAWESIVPVTSGITQENTFLSKGSANEINLSVGGNYSDQFYIGGSLNIPQYHYESTRTFRETNTSSTQSPLNYYDVVEDLTTDGVGFNTKIGLIYRPVAPLRIGLTYVSPTWASFTDNYITSMVTDTKDFGVQTANSTETNNGYSDESKYNVTTPMKGIASLSYVFRPAGGDMTKPSGFITADYEYTNFSSMKMKMKNGGPNDQADSQTLNQAIDNTYQAASNFRVGGELKLNIFAIRAGFAYYGNPYKISGIDGSRTYYTGGVGYRNRGLYLDLALVYGSNTRQDQPYTVLPNQENVTSPKPADIKNNIANVTATIGFKF